MAHKYNLYYAMIFENEELDHRSSQVVLYLQFCAHNITIINLNHHLSLEDSKPNSWYNFSLEFPLIAPEIAKPTLH